MGDFPLYKNFLRAIYPDPPFPPPPTLSTSLHRYIVCVGGWGGRERWVKPPHSIVRIMLFPASQVTLSLGRKGKSSSIRLETDVENTVENPHVLLASTLHSQNNVVTIITSYSLFGEKKKEFLGQTGNR